MRAVFFFYIVWAGAHLGIAQEKEKDTITYLQEVIVTDPLIKSEALGIVNSKVIGPAVFQNYSPTDIPASLNQIAGVYLLSGALNTNRITIRGVGARTPFGTDKLRLYYNDIPVTNGTGFSTIEAFDLENFTAIEVIKGPKGTAFGTNLGGAIGIRTRIGTEQVSTFSNKLTVGSYGLFKNNLGFNHNDGPLTLGLHYSHMDLEGYRDNSRFDRDGLLLTASYGLGSRNLLGILVNHIDYSAQIPSSLSQTAFDDDPQQAAFTWRQAKGFEANKYTLLGLSYGHQFNDQFKNTTSVFYNYLDHYEPRPFNILDEFTNGYGFRTLFTANLSIADRKGSFVLGAELYKDEYHWNTYENLYEENNGNGSLRGLQLSDNTEFRRQFNAFGTLTIPLTTKFLAQLGLNINKTNYDFNDLFNTGEANKDAIRNFDWIFLPSLNLEYTINKSNQVYANISRGFSNPSLEETLTPDGVINPDIKQETGSSYELGGLWSLVDLKLKIDLAVYQMDIKNLLVAQRIGEDQFIGRNAGSTRHRGIELELNQTLVLSGKTVLKPFLSYSLSDHKFADFIDGDNDYSGNALTGVPKHRLNLGLGFDLPGGFYWNTSALHVGEIPLTDANNLYSEAYTVFNTRMGYQGKLSEKIYAGLSLGVNNIMNTKYAQSVLINAVGFGGSEPRYFYPGNNRNYYGGLHLTYQL